MKSTDGSSSKAPAYGLVGKDATITYRVEDELGHEATWTIGSGSGTVIGSGDGEIAVGRTVLPSR